MEFSYRISELEYLRAARLRLRTGRVGKSILFWVVILACLIVAEGFFQKSRQQSTSTQQEAAESVPTEVTRSKVIENVVPAMIFVGMMAFFVFRGIPMQVRREYRKDPAMQGQITVNITPESICTESTAGTFSKTGWNIYDYWREGKGLIMLVFHSGLYIPISLAGLSEPQRDELRGILTAALPKK